MTAIWTMRGVVGPDTLHQSSGTTSHVGPSCVRAAPKDKDDRRRRERRGFNENLNFCT